MSHGFSQNVGLISSISHIIPHNLYIARNDIHPVKKSPYACLMNSNPCSEYVRNGFPFKIRNTSTIKGNLTNVFAEMTKGP